MIRPLGRELERRDAEAWKQAIRVIGHELNNSLAPISSLVHCSAELLKFVEDGFDWTTNLSEFQTKVLFLRCDRNTVANLEHQQELAAAYPNAQILTMSDVGHEMMWDKPDEYLDHTRAYFREIGFAP